jgi:hypothetical protein
MAATSFPIVGMEKLNKQRNVRDGSMVLKKGSLFSANSDSVWLRLSSAEVAMMGRQTGDQSQLFYLFNLEGRIPASHLLRRINPVVTRVLADLREKLACVYRILDSAWTQRTDGVSSRPDEGSVQADSRRPDFALQVESKAGGRNPGLTATDQCASPAGTETTAAQQYRSFSVCLALSLVPLGPWRDCHCQAGDDHSLAPRWVSSVLALAIAQPCW